MSKVIGITVDDDMYEKIVELATKENRPIANMARVLIRRYLKICDYIENPTLTNLYSKRIS